MAAPASAQITPEEASATYAREALAQLGSPRGAIPLLRMYGLRDWVDPSGLLERIRTVSAAPRAPASRRALALRLEAMVRQQLGDVSAAEHALQQLGYITDWLVVGPFENEGRAGFERALPVEADRAERPDPARAYPGLERAVHWRPLPNIASMGYVALDAVARPARNACAFVHTTASAPRDEDAVLWLGASGQIRAYVNGADVFHDDAVRRAFPDRVGVRVRLQRGGNRILLKVCTDSHPLGFYARLSAPGGGPLAGVTFSADPANAPVQHLAAGPTPHAPAPQGLLPELRAAAERPHATAQDVDDYARYLALTGGDNSAAPQAADLAERAAQLQPTVERWLLVAELATERNRRLRALERAAALAPTDPRVLTAAAHEQRVGPHPDDALAMLDRAIAADDGAAVAHIERALLLESIGLSLAARRELELAAVRSPRAAALVRVRASMADHAQLPEESEALWRAYSRMRYDDPAGHEALARAARARGAASAVRAHTEHMLAVHPERLELYQTSAELLEASGQGDAALGTLVRAVEIAPDEPSLWRARGELEVRLRRPDDARASLRHALALSPQDQTARQHIESLEPPVPRPDEALAEASETFLRRRHAGPPGSAGHTLLSLQELTVRTVYPNGLAGSFRQAVFEVQTREGADAARSYPVYFEPEAQRFELRAARVYHPDGSVDESAGAEEYGVGGSQGMYVDRRAVNVTFPRLNPGDVVEIRYRIDDVSQRNAFANYFGDLNVFQSDIPHEHVGYVLRAPAATEFYFHVPALPTLQRSTRTDGATRTYTFEATAIPALAPEDNAPPLTERAAYIHVSTYRTWEDVGRWYWGLISDQLQLDDRVRGIVRDITRGLNTPRERVRAIYNWVIHNTRYVALEFGIHGFLPYRVPQVCARGFGDCKDKASTIVAMLREVGIDASIVLVRTRTSGMVEPTPASLAVFNHAIAYVPPMEGYPQGLYLDGTAQDSGMDELPGADQGAMALVVNQRGEAHLTQLPTFGADVSGDTQRIELTVRPDRSATAHIVADYRGSNAALARASLEAESTRIERIESALARSYPGVHASNVRTNNLHDVDHPAHVEYDIAVPEYGARQGDAVLLPLAPAENLTRELASRSSRSADVVFQSPPRTSDHRSVVHLPAGATVVDVPPDARIDSPFIRLELTFERQGGSITAHRVLTFLVNRVPVQQYAAFREVVQRIDDAMARRATVRLPGGAP